MGQAFGLGQDLFEDKGQDRERLHGVCGLDLKDGEIEV
jgi:hypothetical protein